MPKSLKLQKTVVIADDHTMVRDGTAKLLSQMTEVTLVAQAENGLQAIAMVKKHKPDLLVLDAAMPMARGVEVYAEARRWSPNTKVILQTGFTGKQLLKEWLESGVDGILLKSCDQTEMINAFETVLAGGVYLAEAVTVSLNEEASAASLTDREREVLALIVTGNTNQAAANRLCLSVKTIEKHRASLMTKLGVRTVAQLMVYALKEGLLDEFKQL